MGKASVRRRNHVIESEWLPHNKLCAELQPQVGWFEKLDRSGQGRIRPNPAFESSNAALMTPIRSKFQTESESTKREARGIDAGRGDSNQSSAFFQKRKLSSGSKRTQLRLVSKSHERHQ